MAKQKGIIKLDGTMGDITFYRTKDGYMAREKGGVSAERIMNDPIFQRTRENGAEFGRAGKAGKTLRNSIQALVKTASDSRMVSRLTKQMLKAIQKDPVNPRGERNLMEGDTESLQGFEFNANGKLSTTLFAPYTANLDRTAGEATITFEAFVPTNGIIAPSGSTHFQIVAAAMEIDFQNESFITSFSETNIQSFDTTLGSTIELQNALPEESILPLFLVMGISFYQEVNGERYILNNGAYNALQIIKVSKNS